MHTDSVIPSIVFLSFSWTYLVLKKYLEGGTIMVLVYFILLLLYHVNLVQTCKSERAELTEVI